MLNKVYFRDFIKNITPIIKLYLFILKSKIKKLSIVDNFLRLFRDWVI